MTFYIEHDHSHFNVMTYYTLMYINITSHHVVYDQTLNHIANSILYLYNQTFYYLPYHLQLHSIIILEIILLVLHEIMLSIKMSSQAII